MTTPSEQWIVGALRQATDRMALPPESRWIRGHHSTPHAPTIAVVGIIAIFIVAVGITIGALRVEPRAVPAAGGDAFVVREDAEWTLAKSSLPSDFVLLRPSWFPSEFHGSADCPSPWATLDVLNTGYVVRYQGRTLPNGRCAWLLITGTRATVNYAELTDGLIETNTVNARGTVIHIRSGTPRTNLGSPPALPQIYLWWRESGATYEVISNDAELVDLVRVIGGLEPMR
jgi:hypothetical protein